MPIALVFQLPLELSKGRILHALGESSFHEAIDGELLDAQPVIHSYQPGCCLMNEVVTLMTDMLMQPSDSPAGTLPPSRAVAAAGQAPLGSTNAAFRFPEVSRRSDAGAVGEHDEIR